MSIYCNKEIMAALKGEKFPKSKNELINIAENYSNLSEASIIALNRLDEKVYKSLDDVCENIKIVCNLEIRDALKKIIYPVNKSEIMSYIENKNFSSIVVKTLDELPDDIIFNDISDICK
jgi:hypothetical protein